METIHVDFDDSIAMVMLNHGVTNAINPQLVHELAQVLQSVRDHPNVRALVLTSTDEKFFSIGFDLPRLLRLSRDGFTEFYASFNRVCMQLHGLRKPTIAAIPGHAVAGGCILAICCDWRLIAEGRKLMGLNEIKLAVPIPYPAVCILDQIVGARHAREIMETGELFAPERLLELGVVDQVLPLEELMPRAMQIAKDLAGHPADTFALIKSNRVEPVTERIRARLVEEERLFVEHWHSEEARARLREASKRF